MAKNKVVIRYFLCAITYPILLINHAQMKEKHIKILLVSIPLILAAMFVFDRVSKFEKIKTDPDPVPVEVSEETFDIRAKLAEIFSAEIGVREATGRNDGVRVEQYLASCGLGAGHPWCAAFVNWCHVQAGIQGAGSAWSPDWFPASHTIYSHGASNNTIPARADVFGQYFTDKKRIAHVGFIDEWRDGDSYCMTVEGNTNGDGSREGDGVYRKRRLKNQIYKVSRWT
jgi:hypothetical protein